MVTRPSPFTSTPSLKASVMSLFVALPLGSMTLTENVAPSQGRNIKAPP